jgi:anti-sigma factor RsiW
MAPDDEELLGFALDGEALPVAKKAHLDQCDICQQRLARYKHVNSTLVAKVYRRLCPSGTQLSFYCADLLPAAEKTTIAAHILDCPLCASEVMETRRFMHEVHIDDISLSDIGFTPRATIRRVFGQLVRQQAQLVLRNDSNNISEKSWPRQYRAESIDLSLHLSRASNGESMLLGILTSVDNAESVDAFEDAPAELYPTTYASDIQDGETTAPSCQASVDDLGNIVFKPVPAGDYILIVHLPDQEVIIEDININYS